MELAIIILLLLVFVLLIVMTVKNHLSKSERQKYYAAAGNILREEFLNYSLQNTVSPKSSISEPSASKYMLYLKSKSSGKKTQFVFDPEKEIVIGRDNARCTIYINEAEISQIHSRIYSSGGRVFLQDMNSSNGTYVKRGLLKKYELRGGNQIELRTGDKIIIGACVFNVCLFYYDLNTM